MSVILSHLACSNSTYSWICDDTGCLNLNNLLNELDTAYANPCRTGVPSFQYIRLNGGHLVPNGDVDGVLYAVRNET